MPSRHAVFALALLAAPAFSEAASAQDLPLPPQPRTGDIGAEIYEKKNLIIAFDDHDIATGAIKHDFDDQGTILISPLPEFNFVNIRCAGVGEDRPRFNLQFQMIEKDPSGEKVGYEQNMRDRAAPFLDENGNPVPDTILSRSFAVSGDRMRILDRPEDYQKLLQDLQNGRWNTSGTSTIENSARFLSEVRAICLNLG